MDNGQFEKIMRGIDAPPADENAKKRALNLALAEFDTVQAEKKNNPQGSSLLSRLTGSSNKNTRRTVMNKKRLAGLSTAMALVLAAYLYIDKETTTALQSVKGWPMALPISNSTGNDFSRIASKITAPQESALSKITGNIFSDNSKNADMKQKGQQLASTETYKKSEREANAPLQAEELKEKTAPAAMPATKMPVMDAGAANGAAAQRVEEDSVTRQQPQYAG